MGPRQREIRIDDLKEPRVTDLHLKTLRYWEENPVRLTADAILSAAAHTANLEDYGAEDFLKRLRNWLKLVETDYQYTELGRARVFQRCVKYCISRLRMTDLLKRHPEIHDVEIRKPIILIGPPRSGTTYLVNLLASDSRLRSLPLWESYEPIPPQITSSQCRNIDTRFRRCQQEWRELKSLVPYMEAMHPLNAEGIHEEVELQGPNFSRWLWEWMGHNQKSHNHYSGPDYHEHYEYMKTVLKALQWLTGPDRWVLKSVQHLNHIDHLISAFPDATLVMTHRDPVAMIASHVTMIAYLERLDRNIVDTQSIGEYWIEQTDSLLHSYIRYSEMLPANQIVDISFRKLCEDPTGVATQIYEAAGIPFPANQRTRLRTYVASHINDHKYKLIYNLSADFETDLDELKARFSYYYENYLARHDAA